MSNPMYQPSHPKEYPSPEACHSPSMRPATFQHSLPMDIRNMTGCKVDNFIFKRRLDKYLSTIPDEPQVQFSEEPIRTAFYTWESLSMPTGHRKWKCLVTEIRPAEGVALTALPGHSDAQRYYKVTW